MLQLVALSITLLVQSAALGNTKANDAVSGGSGFSHFHGIKPVHYNVTFKIDDPIQSTILHVKFGGDVELTFTAVESVSVIQLHSVGLNINSAWLCEDGAECKTVKCLWNETILTVDPERNLTAGKSYKIQLLYTGQFAGLNSKNHRGTNFRAARGIFYSQKMRWVEGSKVIYSAITTRFQMEHARKAFPCVDLPGAKATFSTSVEFNTTRTDTIILGNTPVKETSETGAVTFEKTPVMSPYLLAFAILNGYETDNGVGSSSGSAYYPPIPGCSSYAGAVLGIAKEAQEAVAEYTGVQYPLTKLDFIVHQHFETVDGVENFGLVTLSGFHASNELGKMILAVHEVVHQWIGNIVTVSDWNLICIQEGLTTYIQEFYAEELGVRIRPPVRSDVSKETGGDYFPLVRDFENIDDVKVCYKRSFAIMTAIANLIGGANFQKWVRYIFNRYQYSSMGMEDFVSTLSDITDRESVAKTMYNLYTMNGLPLLYVDVKNSTTGNGFDVTVVLKQVVVNGTIQSGAFEGALPIFFETDYGTRFFAPDISARETNFTISDCGQSTPYVKTDGSVYGVYYSESHYKGYKEKRQMDVFMNLRWMACELGSQEHREILEWLVNEAGANGC